MIVLTGEVAFPLHGAIVLAFGVIQYDTHPFPRSKESGANIGNSTPLTLPYHFHYRANLGEKKEDERQRIIIHLIVVCLFFPLSCVCVGKVTHLWRFTTLHCSCAAHFADQWAGQLEDLGNTDGEKCGER